MLEATKVSLLEAQHKIAELEAELEEERENRKKVVQSKEVIEKKYRDMEDRMEALKGGNKNRGFGKKSDIASGLDFQDVEQTNGRTRSNSMTSLAKIRLESEVTKVTYLLHQVVLMFLAEFGCKQLLQENGRQAAENLKLKAQTQKLQNRIQELEEEQERLISEGDEIQKKASLLQADLMLKETKIEQLEDERIRDQELLFEAENRVAALQQAIEKYPFLLICILSTFLIS